MTSESRIVHIVCTSCGHPNTIDIDALSLQEFCDVCSTKLDIGRIVDLRSLMPRENDGTVDLF